jgi:hypothetical protein
VIIICDNPYRSKMVYTALANEVEFMSFNGWMAAKPTVWQTTIIKPL